MDRNYKVTKNDFGFDLSHIHNFDKLASCLRDRLYACEYTVVEKKDEIHVLEKNLFEQLFVDEVTTMDDHAIWFSARRLP